MNKQLPLEQEYSPKADLKAYNDWILTVGELREKLTCRSDDTLVRISASSKTAFGSNIDISMPIESIGNAGLINYNGEKKLIYLSGVGYPQEGAD